MNRSLKLALFCGGFPLVAGVTIFLLWWATGSEWLMLAGIWNIIVGLALFAVGLVSLIFSCSLQLFRSDLPRPRAGVQSLALLLLLANFPAALGIWVAVIAIVRGETRYVVAVHNGAPQPLVNCRVTGAGCMVSFGDVPPGGRVERSFHIQQRGNLELQASLAGTAISQLVEDDVDSESEGAAGVGVGPDGKVVVSLNHD